MTLFIYALRIMDFAFIQNKLRDQYQRQCSWNNLGGCSAFIRGKTMEAAQRHDTEGVACCLTVACDGCSLIIRRKQEKNTEMVWNVTTSSQRPLWRSG